MHPEDETMTGDTTIPDSTLSPDILNGRKKLMGSGAEALIYEGEWLGLDVVMKHRQPREYREPEMDAILRRRRCRMEARLMVEGRKAGVRTPFIFDIDPEEAVIVMELIRGLPLKECVTPGNCRSTGRGIGRLHEAGIVHGDLTTSNIIMLEDGSPCFIDFGLGEKSTLTETRGVDLHVFMEAFESTHSEKMEYLEEFLRGYSETCSAAPEVIERCREIAGRGRYR